MAPRDRAWLKTIGVIVASFLLVSLCGVLYTNWVNGQSEQRFHEAIRQSNQQWCALVSTLDDAYQTNPPTTPTGRRVAQQVHELRVEFGCPTLVR